MSQEKNPIYVLPDNVSRTIGKTAQRNNILAAKLIADIVKTTLGPKGMDKMIVDSTGNVTVTNDGVTILEEMEIDHPAAKMIVDIAKTQESEVGDGTTTAAMLAGKFLENAEKLLNKNVHPTVIVKGYKIATERAIKILNEISKDVNNRKMLLQVAETSMTGKVAESYKEKLSEIIVMAVEQITEGREVDIEDVKIEKIKGESAEESELVRGVIIDKERANKDMPSIVNNAKIALLDFPLEIRNPESETRISVSSPEQLESFINAEEKYIKTITEKIINSGASVVLCQKGIDDVAQYYLAKAGILAIRRILKSDLEKISRATGAKIISNLNDLGNEVLGNAKIVEEIKIGEESVTYIGECENPRSVTIVIRGGTNHVIDEVARAVKDGLGDVIAVVKSGKIVAGGGAIEVELARRLRSIAKTFTGKEQLAIEEFANSLECIPEALAENAGLDPIDTLTDLRKRHESGLMHHGLNLFKDKIEDNLEAGIIEPLKVKTQAIQSASEVATMILRIDDVLISDKNSTNQKSSQYEGMD